MNDEHTAFDGELSGRAGGSPQREHFIDVAQLSRRLSLSVRTIRSFILDPELRMPAYRIRGKYLFNWTEVVGWIERHRIQAAAHWQLITDGLVRELKGNGDENKEEKR